MVLENERKAGAEPPTPGVETVAVPIETVSALPVGLAETFGHGGLPVDTVRALPVASPKRCLPPSPKPYRSTPSGHCRSGWP